MSARDLLERATPRPWRIELTKHEDADFPCEELTVVGPDTYDVCWVAGEQPYEETDWPDARLIVAAVNEYEAHVDVEDFARLVAEHYATIAPPGKLDAGMTRLKDALARLDAVRSGVAEPPLEFVDAHDPDRGVVAFLKSKEFPAVDAAPPTFLKPYRCSTCGHSCCDHIQHSGACRWSHCKCGRLVPAVDAPPEPTT